MSARDLLHLMAATLITSACAGGAPPRSPPAPSTPPAPSPTAKPQAPPAARPPTAAPAAPARPPAVSRATFAAATSSPFADSSADWVLIPATTDVQDIAVAARSVFIATQTTLFLFDRQRGAWHAPLGTADGYLAERPTAMAADPLEDAAWVATAGGMLSYYHARVGAAVHARLPGNVEEIVFDRRAPTLGALARVGGSWFVVSRSGAVRVVPPVALPTIEERSVRPPADTLRARHPVLTSATITRDASLHSFPVSAMSESPTGDEVWVGTTGGGAFRVDPQTGRSEQMVFGPLETGVSALAMSSGSLWIGGMGKSPSHRSGLTTTGSEMARWQWLDAPFARIAGARAFDISAGGDTVWVASDLGLARASLRSGDLRYWNRTAGFTSDAVFSVLRAPRGAWAGTAGGLIWVPDAGVVRPAHGVPDRTKPVRAMAMTGDTLWVGSDAGVLVLRPAAVETELKHFSSGRDPVLDGRIVGFAAHDSVLAIAADHGAELVNLRTGFILPRPAAADYATIGGATSVALDERALWVGGAKGAMVIVRATRRVRPLLPPRDLPGAGEVYDIALDARFAWIATSSGLLRIRRGADGGIP